MPGDRLRYSSAARWFHWMTALLVLAVIALGWIFGGFKTKPGDPNTYVAPFPGTPTDYASAHMSVGLIILAVVGTRLLYRLFNPAPPLPNRMGEAERVLAHLTHWLLYGILIVMPVSGYLMSAGDKPPIVFLGVIDVPKLPITPAQGYAAAVVHVYTQFAVYALVSLHLAGTAWHMFVRRDNLLDRMLPEQHAADAD